MHDAAHRVLAQHAADQAAVPHRADDERHLREPGQPAGVAGGQVVEDDDVLARRGHRVHDVRADVPGSAGDQPGHPRTAAPAADSTARAAGPASSTSGRSASAVRIGPSPPNWKPSWVR